MKQSFLSRIPRLGWIAGGVAILVLAGLIPGSIAQDGQTAPGAENQGVSIAATIFGSYDYEFEGRGAWVGHALVSFGGDTARVARFADRNTSKGRRNNGAIYGTEIISLQFEDGSGSFDIVSRFDGIPNATPGLYTLHETGTIANGTGVYANASGQVTVSGPFLIPNPRLTTTAPPWLAEIHGSILAAGLR